MGMSREEAILKIKKCLALAKSANENEAAIALRQSRGKLDSFTPKDRNKGKAFNDRAANDYHAGKQSGKSAKLNQAMNGGKQFEKLGAGS